jgi:hypothetical protein
VVFVFLESIKYGYPAIVTFALPHWLYAVLVILATYRVTRLLAVDSFPLIAGPRKALQQRWGWISDTAWETWKQSNRSSRDAIWKQIVEASDGRTMVRPSAFKRSVAYLVGCMWCTSIWVSAAGQVVLVLVWHEGILEAVLLGLAASAVTGLIAQRERD